MKEILSLFLVLLSIGSAKAQYQNTSWKGTYNIPEPTEIILQFKQDTLLLNNFADGSNVEAMIYKMNGDTLILTKIRGISPCYDQKGIYKLSIKNDQLFMTLIEDDCDARVSALQGVPLVKLQ